MASVVYNGVGGGGTLFEGYKFHFLIRVPSRKTWQDLVEANGGELERLEKNADIIIADHARKDAPPGSISWTFIDQSVKKGRLEDMENHRIASESKVVRNVGSSAPTRQGRTPFTHEDDTMLMEWCVRAERRGVALGGNQLYIQLEAKNPRHTYQSWRDRWVKYISHRPRPELPDEEDEEEEIPRPSTLPPRRLPRPINRNSGSARSFRSVSSIDDEVEGHSSSLPAKNQQARRANTIQSSLRGISRTNSNPTSDYMRKQREVSVASSSNQPHVAKSKGGNVFSADEDGLLMENYDSIMDLDEDQIIDAWIAWAVEYPNHTPQEWRNRFNKNIKDRKNAEKNQKSSPMAQFFKPDNLPSSVSSKKSGPAPNIATREIKDSQGSSGQTLQSPMEKVVDPALLSKDVFEEELVMFAREAFDLEVDLNPVVSRQKLSLFDLWRTVMSDEFGGFDHVNGMNRWPEVAKQLKLNHDRNSETAKELKDCYGIMLADFETVRAEYRELNPDMALTESQEQAMIVDQLRQTATIDRNKEEDLESHEDETEPQSSPELPSNKRPLEFDRPRVSYNKRQRIDKGKGKELEIPSTPEDQNTIQRYSNKSSPLKQVVSNQQPEDPFQSSNHSSNSKYKTLEPETQDFRYEFEFDDEPQTDGSPSRNKLPLRKEQDRKASPRNEPPKPSRDSDPLAAMSDQAREIHEYMERHISLGYPEDIVKEALAATGFKMENAAFVMEELKTHETIPDNIPGVWTDKEDRELESWMKGDMDKKAEGYRILVLKHGDRGVDHRVEFWKIRWEAEKEEEEEDEREIGLD